MESSHHTAISIQGQAELAQNLFMQNTLRTKTNLDGFDIVGSRLQCFICGRV
jgi:hypothetical protein